MPIIYIYDIIANNKKKFNRIKRRFYYHLNQMPLSKESWKTKSALAVAPKMEKAMDIFFKEFSNDVIVYKINARTISELD